MSTSRIDPRPRRRSGPAESRRYHRHGRHVGIFASNTAKGAARRGERSASRWDVLVALMPWQGRRPRGHAPGSRHDMDECRRHHRLCDGVGHGRSAARRPQAGLTCAPTAPEAFLTTDVSGAATGVAAATTTTTPAAASTPAASTGTAATGTQAQDQLPANGRLAYRPPCDWRGARRHRLPPGVGGPAEVSSSSVVTACRRSDDRAATAHGRALTRTRTVLEDSGF